MSFVLVQYLFHKEENEIVYLKPHGNSKNYYPAEGYFRACWS